MTILLLKLYKKELAKHSDFSVAFYMPMNWACTDLCRLTHHTCCECAFALPLQGTSCFLYSSQHFFLKKIFLQVFCIFLCQQVLASEWAIMLSLGDLFHTSGTLSRYKNHHFQSKCLETIRCTVCNLTTMHKVNINLLIVPNVFSGLLHTLATD